MFVPCKFVLEDVKNKFNKKTNPKCSENSFEVSFLTDLAGFLRHKIAALLRNIDRGLHGLIVTLFLAGLKLAAGGGAVLPWVLVAVGIGDKSKLVLV